MVIRLIQNFINLINGAPPRLHSAWANGYSALYQRPKTVFKKRGGYPQNELIGVKDKAWRVALGSPSKHEPSS